MIKKVIVITLSLLFSVTSNALPIDEVGFVKVAGKKGSRNNGSATIPTPRTEKKIVYSNDIAATEAAKALGYVKTNYRTKNGAAIFKKNNSYISRDVDGHNGGAWKEASSPEKLNAKSTRNGTFDVNMKRIGD